MFDTEFVLNLFKMAEFSDNDCDVVMSQLCQLYEVNIVENLSELSDNDVVMLSQACEDMENLFAERFNCYIEYMNEASITASELGIDGVELDESNKCAIDCRDMSASGGCEIISSWNYSSKGNFDKPFH